MADAMLKYDADTPLKFENLGCRRGGRMVFEGLGFTLRPGEYLHLAGSNGSGKSTLLRVLAGLIPPVYGQISYGDEAVDGPLLAAAGKLLYAGHSHGLKHVWTLLRNCEATVRTLTGKPLSKERLTAALAGFGLERYVEQPVRFFSSGQLHRASLLKFLLIDRQIWLMDEPTVGLDSENRGRLEAVMRTHLEAGGMIIAASHDPIAIEGQTLQMTDYSARSQDAEYWL